MTDKDINIWDTKSDSVVSENGINFNDQGDSAFLNKKKTICE